MPIVHSLVFALQSLRAAAIMNGIGWMLLHSLWQGALLAILLEGLLAATRSRTG